MTESRIVTLLTDFGTRDYYVAAVKGVLLQLAPEVRLTDISHDVAPGDIEHAAFLLAAAATEYPQGTVHLAVVDPGVGTDRRILAAATDGHLAVAPDNGLLTHLMSRSPPDEIRSADRPDMYLDRPGSTFHGRDRFAPIAAYLARGGRLADLGPDVREVTTLPSREPERHARGIRGRIAHIDRFGNLVTDVPSSWLQNRPFTVQVRDLRTDRLAHCYSDLANGEPAVLPGSLGTLELSLKGDSLAANSRIQRGDVVEIEFR